MTTELMSARCGLLGERVDEIEGLLAKIANCRRQMSEAAAAGVPADTSIAARIDAQMRAAAAEKVSWQLARELEGYERALPDARRRLDVMRGRHATMVQAIAECERTIAMLEQPARRVEEVVVRMRELCNELAEIDVDAANRLYRVLGGPDVLTIPSRYQTAVNDLAVYRHDLELLGSE